MAELMPTTTEGVFVSYRFQPWASAIVFAVAIAAPAFAGQPIVTRAVQFEVSRPARDLSSVVGNGQRQAPIRINPLAGEPDHGQRGTWTRGRPPADPLIRPPVNGATPTPPLDLHFQGIGNPEGCGGCSPPDPNGDVGLNEYVQIVNATKIGVYDKTTGNQVQVFDLGSLWSSGTCATDIGDPVAVFDALAQRWAFTQLGSPHHVCIAVSDPSDPLGAYYLYLFDVSDFPDYFKLGAWSDAYLGTANQSSYSAMAFNRTKMLVGDPSAELVRFAGETNLLLPANVSGPSAPAAGGYFFTFKDDQFHGGVDRIELFQLKANFQHPERSTFKLVKAFPIAPFTYTVCGFFNFDCIPQKGTSVLVDAVSEWPMQRLAWRKWKDAISLVGAFTVGGGNGSGGGPGSRVWVAPGGG